MDDFLNKPIRGGYVQTYADEIVGLFRYRHRNFDRPGELIYDQGYSLGHEKLAFLQRQKDHSGGFRDEKTFQVQNQPEMHAKR